MLRFLEPEAELRILDLGCGAGGLMFDLAARLPRARLRGVDLSRENIAAAVQQATGHDAQERLTFTAGDFMTLPILPADLVVSCSALHHVEGSSRALFARIAQTLTPDGLLAYTMPAGGLYNRALWGMRRCFRLVRSRPTDALVLAVARRVHDGYSEAMLRERVPYMYLLPHRSDTSTLHGVIEAQGLSLIASAPFPHASLAQPKHNLTIFRKRPGL